MRRLARPDGSIETIPNGEMSILLALLNSPGRVLDRDTIIGRSRLHATEVSDRSVDLQIGRIRRRLEAATSSADLIVTERGLGYRFSADVEVVHFDQAQG
jgi:DNA-binding response OmpR family regulator